MDLIYSQRSLSRRKKGLELTNARTDIYLPLSFKLFKQANVGAKSGLILKAFL